MLEFSVRGGVPANCASSAGTDRAGTETSPGVIGPNVRYAVGQGYN